MVDRCIQETGTKIGNVACRINFDNLHHIETDVLEGIRERFASEFRLLSFVRGEVHSHHAQWNVIMDPIFKIVHDLDLNKFYPISEALTQCLASMEKWKTNFYKILILTEYNTIVEAQSFLNLKVLP